MIIPSMLCSPSYLSVSNSFPQCFRLFLSMFLRFPSVFLLFIDSVVPYFLLQIWVLLVVSFVSESVFVIIELACFFNKPFPKFPQSLILAKPLKTVKELIFTITLQHSDLQLFHSNFMVSHTFRKHNTQTTEGMKRCQKKGSFFFSNKQVCNFLSDILQCTCRISRINVNIL